MSDSKDTTKIISVDEAKKIVDKWGNRYIRDIQILRDEKVEITQEDINNIINFNLPFKFYIEEENDSQEKTVKKNKYKMIDVSEIPEQEKNVKIFRNKYHIMSRQEYNLRISKTLSEEEIKKKVEQIENNILYEFIVQFMVDNTDSVYYFKDKVYTISIDLIYKKYGPIDFFPVNPPQIVFIDKVFHTNVGYDSGYICLDTLNDPNVWSNINKINIIIISIMSLLDDPNPKSPYNPEASKLHTKSSKEEYRSVVEVKNKFNGQEMLRSSNCLNKPT